MPDDKKVLPMFEIIMTHMVFETVPGTALPIHRISQPNNDPTWQLVTVVNGQSMIWQRERTEPMAKDDGLCKKRLPNMPGFICMRGRGHMGECSPNPENVPTPNVGAPVG